MKYCATCGKPLEDHQAICMSCGCPVQSPAPCVSAAKPACETDPSISPKRGLVVLVMLLALSPFAVHRFYVGKIGSGLLMLALFVIGYILLLTAVALEETAGYTTPEAVMCLCGAGILMLGWLIWWVVDLVAVCSSHFTDTQGRTVKLS